MHELIKSNLGLIAESIDLIETRMVDVPNANYFVQTSEGRTLLDSVSMRLQFIGETVKRIDKIDPEFYKKNNFFEWHKIMNLRDFISHHYEMLNHEIIYNICTVNIPQLKIAIMKLLN
jgi:uncharacterized protein with HEPN domain